MCWPTFRGAAYLASSIFIYRAIQVVFNMLSSFITGLKATYLPISEVEELLLQLIYFIPLFTTSSFALLGVESDSHNFILFSTVALSITLLFRYSAEIAYIYVVNWEAYRSKILSLSLNIITDFLLIFVLLIYVQHKQKVKQEILLGLIEEQEKEGNVVEVRQEKPIVEQPTLQRPANARPVGVGIGQGFGEGMAIHYPFDPPMNVHRLERPLPPLPSSYKSSKSPSVVSFDYDSIPPTRTPSVPPMGDGAPIASPDYDDI